MSHPLCLGDLGPGSGTSQIRAEGLSCLWKKGEGAKKPSTKILVAPANTSIAFSVGSFEANAGKKRCKTYLKSCLSRKFTHATKRSDLDLS